MEDIQYNEEDLHDHEGIGVVIRDLRGYFLLLHHNKYNFLTIPIGKVKPGQTIVEGLISEMSEELDIMITSYSDFGYFTKKYSRNGIDVNVNIHVFEVLSWDGYLKNNEPDKHRGIYWGSLEELSRFQRTSDATRFVVDSLCSSHQNLVL